MAAADEILRVEEIDKRFQHRNEPPLQVLKQVSLAVKRGEVLVVIGPSGSGKSTLLRCINFLSPPDSGSVTLLGETLSCDPLPRLAVRDRLAYERRLRYFRTHVGMVFQHFNLFPHMTVLENVASAPIRVLGLRTDEARARALEELERVGIAEKAQAYPSQLSGGQKQRVAIARALAMRPQLMLFDEATSALDPELIGGILEEMQRLAESGMTMIVVTHEMGFAREVGDRVVFMDQGEILEEGPAQRVLTEPRNPRAQEFLRAIL